MVGVVALAATTAGITLAVGEVVAARHRVEAVADTAALAAVGASADGADACRRAQRVASAAETEVVTCRRGRDGSVSVVVRSSVGGGPAGAVVVTGRARAGPCQVCSRTDA